jgi:hypothetical protein
MAGEKEPKFETKSEHIPTEEEINAIFKELTNEEYKEVRRIEDEQGLYVLEIAIPGEKEGEIIQYEYIRRGPHREQTDTDIEIHVVYYEDGIPVHGTSAARFTDEAWVIF